MKIEIPLQVSSMQEFEVNLLKALSEKSTMLESNISKLWKYFKLVQLVH